MSDFRLFVDLAALLPNIGKLPEGAALDAGNFPSLQDAVRRAAEAAAVRWRAYASGAPLPGGGTVPEKHQKAYAESIHLVQTGDFSAEIFSGYAKADLIHEGEPPRDLKEMLWTSKKVRKTLDGHRYLIIPFRWTKPPGIGWTGGANEMDFSVAHWWTNKKRAVALGPGSPAERGAHLREWQARRLGLDVDSPGKGRNQVNMVAYRPSGQKASPANTSFMTFRTMGDWQADKWIVPAKPALPIPRTVYEEIRQEAAADFSAAAAEDLGRMTEGLFSMRPGGGPALRKIPGRRKVR